MTGMLSILGLVMGLLHLVGGFIAFVWLLFLGQWSTVGVGVLALVLSGLVIRAALLPGLWLFGVPAAVLEKGPQPGRAKPFYALIGANTVVVMGAWCLLWVWLFLGRAEPDTRIPMLLWAYAVSVTPWVRMARKSDAQEAQEARAAPREPGSREAQSVTLVVQVAFICGGVAWLGGWAPFHLAALPLWCLALVAMAATAVRQRKAPRRRPVPRMAKPGATTIEGEGAVSPPSDERQERERHEG
ncbi:MAG TPA: hypothetical protein VK013_00310 [Myxococcaceae bacterium]|nr:hypothetical protein [Myxococcaceae bacterium]